MSALAGILRFDGRPGASNELAPIMRSLEPLGRDNGAVWDGGMVALGRRLTRILPEDDHDRQPFHATEQGLTCVAIGRVDNRAEIIRALNLGPAAISDAGLMFEAWRRWGDLGRLAGVFVLAIWDARARKLVCIRSQLEAPPLYWHRGAGFFAFATAASALFAMAEIPRRVNEQRIADELLLMPPEPTASFYDGVSRLPTAHALVVDADGRVSTRRYWSLADAPALRLKSDGDYEAAFLERFDLAVAACLRARHPIGSHLSGGRDSSAVTAVAARQLAASGRRLTAFTSVPREGYDRSPSFRPNHDEGPAAAEAAALYANIDHVLIRPDGKTPLDLIDRFNLTAGRPMPNPPNMLWLDGINDAARQRGIRVLLTGAVGNLSISYTGSPYLAALARRGDWIRLFREMWGLRRHYGFSWHHLASYAFEPHLPPWLPQAARWMTGRERTPWQSWSAISPDFAKETRLEERARIRDWDLRHAGPRRLASRVTDSLLAIFDEGDYLNRQAQGWGIETRDPTADRRVMEFCHTIPGDQFLRDGRFNHLYRRVFTGIVPRSVIDPAFKGSQAADWHESLTPARALIAAELERLANSPLASRALDLPRLRKLVDAWPASDILARDKGFYRLTLTRGLAVGRFIRWVEGGNQ